MPALPLLRQSMSSSRVQVLSFSCQLSLNCQSTSPVGTSLIIGVSILWSRVLIGNGNLMVEPIDVKVGVQIVGVDSSKECFWGCFYES